MKQEEQSTTSKETNAVIILLSIVDLSSPLLCSRISSSIEASQTLSLSSMSNNSDREEILKLKRKITHQNQIIKKQRKEKSETKKEVISMKKEYNMIINKYNEEKHNKELSWSNED